MGAICGRPRGDVRAGRRVLSAYVAARRRDDRRALLDAPGHVPWWPEPYDRTTLFAVLVHVLGDSNRHAGHADILREGLDGRTGLRPEHEQPIDEDARAAHRAMIERVARLAAPGPEPEK